MSLILFAVDYGYVTPVVRGALTRAMAAMETPGV
jgi:hypothetical protein